MSGIRLTDDVGRLAQGDLIGSLTIDNIRLSDVGPALEALREAGFQVEINVARPWQKEDR